MFKANFPSARTVLITFKARINHRKHFHRANVNVLTFSSISYSIFQNMD